LRGDGDLLPHVVAATWNKADAFAGLSTDASERFKLGIPLVIVAAVALLSVSPITPVVFLRRLGGVLLLAAAALFVVQLGRRLGWDNLITKTLCRASHSCALLGTEGVCLRARNRAGCRGVGRFWVGKQRSQGSARGAPSCEEGAKGLLPQTRMPRAPTSVYARASPPGEGPPPRRMSLSSRETGEPHRAPGNTGSHPQPVSSS
jgi:hypothetical protein